MKLGEFLGERMGRVVMQGVFVLAAAVILLVTGTQAGIVVILGVFWVVMVSGVLIFDYFRELGHLRELESIMDGLDQKQLIIECAPEPDTVYERALFSLMRRAGKDMIETVSDARAAQKEYREYIESWVHEIKTPITDRWNGFCSMPGRSTRNRTSSSARPHWTAWWQKLSSATAPC